MPYSVPTLHHPSLLSSSSASIQSSPSQKRRQIPQMHSSSSRWSHENSYTPSDQISIDDDYIDMDVSSTFLCFSSINPNSPPHHSREFEFQMSQNSKEKQPTTSPADELFYKGQLLPLHLPPRLQMVQELLHNCNTEERKRPASEGVTPFESCNITPSDSRHVSRELDPDEYFYECSIQNTAFVDQDLIFLHGGSKKSWSKKLRLIKHSSLGSKLKASRAYIRSLFSKSGCSDESCAVDGKVRKKEEILVESPTSKAKDCLNKCMKVAKRNPFGQIQRESYQVAASVVRGVKREHSVEDDGHRRSFSGAIKTHSSSFSSSSSSSSLASSCSSFSSGNSTGVYGLQLLKRSSSANSEVESSIQGAIAHCKQSQQLVCSRKSTSEVGFCSLSASRIAACEPQERPWMCRG